jgi:hypothetical protein
VNERRGETLVLTGVVHLTGTISSGIILLDFEKGMEEDAARERHQREAATGCKQLLPEPETATASEPPTDM